MHVDMGTHTSFTLINGYKSDLNFLLPNNYVDGGSIMWAFRIVIPSGELIESVITSN